MIDDGHHWRLGQKEYLYLYLGVSLLGPHAGREDD